MDHPASTNSNYVINNITTNITCMQVLTIVLLMICNGQNPGSSMSGTSHNKCSKMPPPTSMHLCIEVGGGACDVSCDVIYYVTAVRARRMVRIFFLPYLGNRSKLDPCSYELFCLESHTIISQSIADSSWITLYICVCVCVCVRAWERERERELLLCIRTITWGIYRIMWAKFHILLDL